MEGERAATAFEWLPPMAIRGREAALMPLKIAFIGKRCFFICGRGYQDIRHNAADSMVCNIRIFVITVKVLVRQYLLTPLHNMGDRHDHFIKVFAT